MALITPFEVIKYSPAGKDYPTADLCAIVPQVEEEFARDCLGATLYDYLTDNLVEYPSGTAEWDSTQEYDTDEYVIREGCLFCSTVDNNTADPLDGTDDWAAFERFDDEGCNLLWTRYLRQILALKSFSSDVLFATWRAGAGGVTVNTGDTSGNRAGNKGEIADIKNGLQQQTERVTENMLAWLDKNAAGYGLPLAASCRGMCQTSARNTRRWGWKH